MWGALDGLSRYIATARVAKHRLFVWCDVHICPDSKVIVVARDDDTTLGILHSRFHEHWSLRLDAVGMESATTPSTIPPRIFQHVVSLSRRALAGHPGSRLTLRIGATIVIAEAEPGAFLVELRDRCTLSRPPRMDRVGGRAGARISIGAQFPATRTPRPGPQALPEKRTLTNLYNARPQWLADAHAALDAAVAAAYRVARRDITDEDALRELLNLGKRQPPP